MAIEKVKTRKAEFTAQSWIELGIAAVLGVVSLLCIFVSLGRWRMKAAIVSALEEQDSNRPGLVAEHCRSALARDAEYHLARQLLAKVLVDQATQDPTRLAEAEKEYQALLNYGYNRGHVHVGLGIIHLMRADASPDGKQASDWAAKARLAFQAARTVDAGCVEARIGLAHVELFLALRVKDDGDGTGARAAFEAVRKDVESNAEVRSKITRGALVDLYAGLARSYTSRSGYSPEADRCYRICYQYAPQWPVPLVNLAYIDAQRLVANRISKTDLDKDADLRALTQMLQAVSTSPGPDQAVLNEAYLARELAAAYAYGMAEDIPNFRDRLGRLPPGRLEVLRLAAIILTDLAMRTANLPETRRVHANLAQEALRALLEHERVKDPKNVEERRTVLNNLAAMLELDGVLNSTSVQFAHAERNLLEALGADKTDYLLNRNLAIVQRRMESAEVEAERKNAYRGAAGRSLEAARAAAGGDARKLGELKQIEEWNP